MPRRTRRTAGADPTAWFAYGHDVHGSVSTLLDDAGVVVAAYGYTAYGSSDDALTAGDYDPADPTEANDNDPLNAYRYTAKRLDTGAGDTLDMGGRRFAPNVARFLQVDYFNGALADLSLSSDPLTANRYGLAGGNPLSFIEWDGHRVFADGLGLPAPTPAPRVTPSEWLLPEDSPSTASPNPLAPVPDVASIDIGESGGVALSAAATDDGGLWPRPEGCEWWDTFCVGLWNDEVSEWVAEAQPDPDDGPLEAVLYHLQFVPIGGLKGLGLFRPPPAAPLSTSRFGGELFETTLSAPAGDVGVVAEITSSGRRLTLSDITIYSPSGELVNEVGPAVFLRLRSEVARVAASEGFAELRITGVRVAGSSSADPGHYIDLVIDLDRYR